MKASDSIHLLQKQCIKYGETLYNLVTLLFKVILLLMSVIRVKYSDNLCLLQYQLLEMTHLIWIVNFFANFFSLHRFDV